MICRELCYQQFYISLMPESSGLCGSTLPGICWQTGIIFYGKDLMVEKGYFKGLIRYVRLKIWTLSDKETLKDSRRFVDPTVHVIRPSNIFFLITKSPQAICRNGSQKICERFKLSVKSLSYWEENQTSRRLSIVTEVLQQSTLKSATISQNHCQGFSNQRERVHKVFFNSFVICDRCYCFRN